MNIISQQTFNKVDQNGFEIIPLQEHSIFIKSEQIYGLIDKKFDSGKRGTYYNEIAFNWPEDWSGEFKLSDFHDLKTIEEIYSFSEATNLFVQLFGDDLARSFLDFVTQIKNEIIEHHPYSRLLLSRVILRQMNEKESTNHRAFHWHEDQGYSNKKLRQYLSVATTFFGKPTEAKRCQPKVGDLLIFNSMERRKDLKLPNEKAFIHKGPQSGPKLFLFFEFLTPGSI